MKRILSVVIVIVSVLFMTVFPVFAYHLGDAYAVMDFSTEITVEGQKLVEANLITNNTIGSAGTVTGEKIETGNLIIPASDTGIVFVSYLKPNTWGATDFKVNLYKLKYVAVNYKTDNDAKIFIYLETGALEGDTGITYGAGIIEHWTLPSTGGEYKTAVIAVPETAAGDLTHWRVDRLVEGESESELFIRSIGFFSSEADANSYYTPKEESSPYTSDVLITVIPVVFVSIVILLSIKPRKREV